MKSKKSKQTEPALDAIPEELLLQLQQTMGGSDAVGLAELKSMLLQLGDADNLADDSDADDETLDARWQAQELAFDAMDASAREARTLARQALALDPDCVDALAILAEVDAKTPDERVELLSRAVAAGERRLGPDFFRRNKGHFWGLIDTRPYMRTRQKLAETLAAQGRHVEAIGHYEELLALNEGDNQGVRYALLGLYLAVKDLEGARRLFAAYEEEKLTFFAWGRVLERYLAEDLAGATVAWKAAQRVNPHVGLLLTGQTPYPKREPEAYQLFSKDEAVVFLGVFDEALCAHPGFLLWVATQAGQASPRAGRPGFRTSRKRS